MGLGDESCSCSSLDPFHIVVVLVSICLVFSSSVDQFIHGRFASFSRELFFCHEVSPLSISFCAILLVSEDGRVSCFLHLFLAMSSCVRAAL